MKLRVLACWALLQLPLAAERNFVDVAQLEGEYLFTKGELSIAIKPDDSGAVYLVNDTDKPVEGVVSDLTKSVLEAKIRGIWKQCHYIEPECLSVGPPNSLPPRKAMILPLAGEGGVGDQEAEMRYSLGDGVLASSTFRGRYSLRAWAKASFVEALRGDDWEKFPFFRSPEEFVALQELERHYKAPRKGWDLPNHLAEEMPFPEKDRERFQAAFAKILARPQPEQLGAAAFFERCITALSTTPSKKHAYGSPERCRVMVWRRLCAPPGVAPYLNEENKIESEAILAAGNPWGVSKERLAVLMGLSVKALSSKDAFEKHEAGVFLGMTWIREEHFPEGAIDKLLEMDAPEVQKAAAAIRERSKPADPKP